MFLTKYTYNTAVVLAGLICLFICFFSGCGKTIESGNSKKSASQEKVNSTKITGGEIVEGDRITEENRISGDAVVVTEKGIRTADDDGNTEDTPKSD